MLPPTLPTRPWPQTLLLTILALLIAAATIMLACGPVAQPIPEEGDTFTAAPQVEGGSEEPEEEPTATPTPTPERNCAQSVHIPGGEICGPPIPTKPPLKYPKLGRLNSVAVVAEAEAAAAGTSGQSDAAAAGTSGQSEAEVQTVYAWIALEDKASTAAVIAWLESNKVTWFSDRSESDVGRIRMSGDDYIYAYIPVSLLIPLSRQEGVLRLDDGCIRTSFQC